MPLNMTRRLSSVIRSPNFPFRFLSLSSILSSTLPALEEASNPTYDALAASCHFSVTAWDSASILSNREIKSFCRQMNQPETDVVTASASAQKPQKRRIS
ncbi:MAG: hypothetical protein JWM59_4819 [Verrucomicrobiales bacterium]|nr:hypothetical protein [Verrucomicrobiales bacterium]